MAEEDIWFPRKDDPDLVCNCEGTCTECKCRDKKKEKKEKI